MIGRKVRTVWGQEGSVTAWEPLGAGMCDARVTHTDGSICWYGSGDLRPIDGAGPLPSRREAQAAADVRTLQSLQAIRTQGKREAWHVGARAVGRMIDGAILDVEGRIKARSGSV